jgi:hypothetical protein
MTGSFGQGWSGLAIIYGLSTGGLYGGLRVTRQHAGRVVWVLTYSLPVMIGSMLVTTLITEGTRSLGQGVPEILKGILGLMVLVVVSGATGIFLARRGERSIHQRGTRLIDALPRRRTVSTGVQLTFAGQAVQPLDETKHFKIIGTTGTGKTTVIRELLGGALGRGQRAVIADPDGGYLKAFHQADRGDVILNPFDPRSSRWDLFGEIVQSHDADQLARSLISDEDGADRSWRAYARTFLTAVLRRLYEAGEHDLRRLYWFLALAPAEELRELLEATPAGAFLGKDNERFFGSVRSVATAHLAGIEHLSVQREGELLSVRKWIREGKGALFLPYRAGQIAALRNVISTWMRVAIFETMETEERDQGLWFVIDELDALGAVDGLKDALARLRKFGGRCVLGFQSIAQVRGTYGDSEAQTIVENCGNTLILRCSASEHGGTAEFASRLIGQREVVWRALAHSRPPGLLGALNEVRTTSEQRYTEDAVMASEIEQLPDLSGFLKLASGPHWHRVRLRG